MTTTDDSSDADLREPGQIARARTEAQAREYPDDRLLSQCIIAQIPAARKAQARQTHAVVMGLRYGKDYKRPAINTQWDLCDPQWLQGAARLVWDHCVDQRLNPRIYYWFTVGGEDSGFDIGVDP